MRDKSLINLRFLIEIYYFIYELIDFFLKSMFEIIKALKYISAYYIYYFQIFI